MPKAGNEIALLELLDNRRYTVSLTDGDPCAFLAKSSVNVNIISSVKERLNSPVF